jgi:hypothetical protein
LRKFPSDLEDSHASSTRSKRSDGVESEEVCQGLCNCFGPPSDLSRWQKGWYVLRFEDRAKEGESGRQISQRDHERQLRNRSERIEKKIGRLRKEFEDALQQGQPHETKDISATEN